MRKGHSLRSSPQEPLDRRAIVERHTIEARPTDCGSLAQVGNGEFAMALDATGLQTTAGNTMAQWGWHSFAPPPGVSGEDFRPELYDVGGRQVGYRTNRNGQEQLYRWLRENPHRIHLGRLRLLLDGKPVSLLQLEDPLQRMDLWNGIVESNYRLCGVRVVVQTCCHPQLDLIAVRIESALLRGGRLAVELMFPCADSGIDGGVWNNDQAHRTALCASANESACFRRELDDTRYFVDLSWRGASSLVQTGEHSFVLSDGNNADVQELSCSFSPAESSGTHPGFSEVRKCCADHWQGFWNQGGALDLSGSSDGRWRELERRTVLSQYLMAVNCSGSLPPQESGLYNNSSCWHGKFHLEMHWWHGTHHALWGRWNLFGRSLHWYFETLEQARILARSQGYAGARWPKMTGPDGIDSPSAIGPLLIWQQPHPIYYAEMDYRLHPERQTLEKWNAIIEATADFMASYAIWNQAANRYNIGPPMRSVAENTDPRKTCNPAFELSYWRFGLRLAKQWRSRQGLPVNPTWDKVLKGLAPLPVNDGVYLQQEGMTDSYTRWNWEHPALVGPLGMLPGDGVDPEVMRHTVKKVIAEWNWGECWGWDFPMTAMAAARCGLADDALDMLLHPSPKNGFDRFGLGCGGPFPYLPANGGLLFAVAMMAAGWDGMTERPLPGFPADGAWQVRWEGLLPAI